MSNTDVFHPFQYYTPASRRHILGNSFISFYDYENLPVQFFGHSRLSNFFKPETFSNKGYTRYDKVPKLNQHITKETYLNENSDITTGNIVLDVRCAEIASNCQDRPRRSRVFSFFQPEFTLASLSISLSLHTLIFSYSYYPEEMSARQIE